ncbi:MAG: hypothetical protein LUH03_10055 [Oscillospiraceae bacterium]|nr:hypothetical protein [Oscillospiraceae bacterium]
MFVLEYKQIYIVPTELTKNRTCQTYRWKQMAICEEREPLEKIRAQETRPEDWRVVPMGDSVVQGR